MADLEYTTVIDYHQGGHIKLDYEIFDSQPVVTVTEDGKQIQLSLEEVLTILNIGTNFRKSISIMKGESNA